MIRNLFFLLPMLFIGFSVVAQDLEVKADSVDNSEEGKKLHQDMFMVDLNWDYMLGLPAGVTQKWYGRGISLGLLYDYPFTKSGSVSGAVGAGFASHNYYMNALVNRYVVDEVNYSEFMPVGDTIMKRGKMSVNYVDIPFELRFRLKEHASGMRWKFAVGGKVGYLINAHEKVINAENRKFKTYFYPDITQWRYGVSARAGYGSIMVSAFYSLSPFFEGANSVSQQNSLTLGISIVPF
jgi:hypothetical protein